MIRLGNYQGPDLALNPEVVELKRSLWGHLRRPPNERAQRRTPIGERLYFSEAISDPVERRCHNKCVFCERNSELVRLEVGTFRPIRDAIGMNGREDADYYAWLAYEPDNLILICIECSSRKGTHFPVSGERAPYLAGFEEVQNRERPLIVNPYVGRPERHFTFLANGRVEGATTEGRTTVSIIGLDDDHLVEQRADEIKKFLDGLHSSIASYERGFTDEEFSSAKTFAGARLGLAMRIFNGMEVGGQQLLGVGEVFKRRLAQALLYSDQTERDRMQRRIEIVVDEDSVRRVRPSSQFPDTQAETIDVEVKPPSAPPPSGGVQRILFQNFKGLERLEIETVRGRRRSKSTPCLMLLGENSVGKSSVLQGIALTLIGKKDAKKLKLDPSELLRADLGTRWDQLTPSDAHIIANFRLSGRSSEFRVSAETRNLHGGAKPVALVLGYGPHRYFNPKRSDRPNNNAARVRSLFDPTTALPYPGAWLNSLTPEQFAEVAQVLRIVLALDDSDEVVRDVDGRICVAMRGLPVPIERLSEGYRSTFAMVVDIVRELLRVFRHIEDAEAFVIIDEIDAHLHPRWRMRILSALRTALPRVQFIVTTHDPLCLRGMEDGEVVVLQRNEEGKIVKLPDLPSIKGMRADQLLTSVFFGLSSTVDPETELDVARFVDAIGSLSAQRVEEANRLVRQLVLGDSALEQVVQEAMVRFLNETDRPSGAIRSEVRKEAVQTILQALRVSRSSAD